MRHRVQDLFRWVLAGRLKVTIDREYELEDAPAAHQYIEAGRTRGKLLLKIAQ
jgi:NADPH2:quinone reductase